MLGREEGNKYFDKISKTNLQWVPLRVGKKEEFDSKKEHNSNKYRDTTSQGITRTLKIMI